MSGRPDEPIIVDSDEESDSFSVLVEEVADLADDRQTKGKKSGRPRRYHPFAEQTHRHPDEYDPRQPLHYAQGMIMKFLKTLRDPHKMVDALNAVAENVRKQAASGPCADPLCEFGKRAPRSPPPVIKGHSLRELILTDVSTNTEEPKKISMGTSTEDIPRNDFLQTTVETQTEELDWLMTVTVAACAESPTTGREMAPSRQTLWSRKLPAHVLRAAHLMRNEGLTTTQALYLGEFTRNTETNYGPPPQRQRQILITPTESRRNSSDSSADDKPGPTEPCRKKSGFTSVSDLPACPPKGTAPTKHASEQTRTALKQPESAPGVAKGRSLHKRTKAGRKVYCFNCRTYGHRYQDCKYPPKEFCHKCGQWNTRTAACRRCNFRH